MTVQAVRSSVVQRSAMASVSMAVTHSFGIYIVSPFGVHFHAFPFGAVSSASSEYNIAEGELQVKRDKTRCPSLLRLSLPLREILKPDIIEVTATAERSIMRPAHSILLMFADESSGQLDKSFACLAFERTLERG